MTWLKTNQHVKKLDIIYKERYHWCLIILPNDMDDDGGRYGLIELVEIVWSGKTNINMMEME